MHTPLNKCRTILKPRGSNMESICTPKKNRAKLDCLMSEFFKKGRRQDIKNDDMSKALKMAFIKLAYPEIKLI